MEMPIGHGPGDLLRQLRTATCRDHQALDGVLGLSAPDLGLASYTDVLRRFYGFWRVWEPQMAVTLDDAGLFEPRRRLHLLEADLGALGHPTAALSALPTCPPLTFGTRTEAIGSLYVLEGSTLGGREIQRNLVKCFGSQITRHYFNGYGPNTGVMWRSFLMVLDAIPADCADQALYGATATFKRLKEWLSRV